MLGERAADDVGEGREDRVLQLGQHEPDQPGPLAAQLRRSLVAEHVEGGQHRLAGRLGDAGALVEHPADRRLADPDVAGDLGKPATHLRKFTTRSRKYLQRPVAPRPTLCSHV